MKIYSPEYYQSFRCIAQRCPDSCCHGWAVQIDEASAAMYRALPGALGDALRSALKDEDGDTILSLASNGRCPMWREDGLCRIQCQLGEAALSQVCRDFPRLRHDYGDFTELGLELSCPEAARLILSGEGYAMTEADAPGGDAPEYDTDAMSVLLRTRRELLEFLEDRRFSVPQALAVMLLYGYGAQNELDGGEEAVLDPEATLKEALSYAAGGDWEPLLEFYRGLEILTDEWAALLRTPAGSPWSEAHRALARYGIQRYYLQAVSDYDLVGRVKMVIASCLVVKALGGDILRTAQLYSKEIENDADNIDALLDGAYASPALTDLNLLGLLLTQ